VGPRALREGFLRHVGWPPLTYLRRVRLERVHELRDGSPDETSVTETASRWGFGDSDRFAEVYLRIYGRTPAETLRPGRPVTARYGETGP
jgi:transcriptional regulator GlxA family with amidase domain